MDKAAAQCGATELEMSAHGCQAKPVRKDRSPGSWDPESKGTTTVRELSDSPARNACGVGIDKTELANSWAARTASRRVAKPDGC